MTDTPKRDLENENRLLREALTWVLEEGARPSFTNVKNAPKYNVGNCGCCEYGTDAPAHLERVLDRAVRDMFEQEGDQ